MNEDTEAASLEDKLKDETLDHETRANIGDQLSHIGDTRSGVGLRPDGLPDIAWCAVDVPGQKMPFENERGEVYGEFALEPFFIARYPVTVRQFQAFLDAPDGFINDMWWQDLTDQYRKQAVLNPRAPFDNHPRDTVSWYQAVAFARWLNAKFSGAVLASSDQSSAHLIIGDNAEIRLPTEWEWQWAAQGNDRRPYPWGPWDGRFANTRESRLGRTTAVGMYPQGGSWCGALDMSGGLWEWCLNAYKNPDHTGCAGHETRVLRGGSFVDVADWAVCASRFNDLPNRRLDYFGFRVVCASI